MVSSGCSFGTSCTILQCTCLGVARGGATTSKGPAIQSAPLGFLSTNRLNLPLPARAVLCSGGIIAAIVSPFALACPVGAAFFAAAAAAAAAVAAAAAAAAVAAWDCEIMPVAAVDATSVAITPSIGIAVTMCAFFLTE